MFAKKILPLLILITMVVGGISRQTSVLAFQDFSTTQPLLPVDTITVCTNPSCDYEKIQEAIDFAEINDTIQLSSETYEESLTIDKNITILGAGLENTIIQAASSQGAASSRVITITSGISVTLSGITFRHGVASGSGIEGYGGGVLNQGTLMIQNCLITQNISDYGGGIANDSRLGPASTTLSNSSIQQNDSTYNGAGILNQATTSGNTSTITITQSTISNNNTENGGGIANIAGNNGTASVSIFNSTLSENSVDSHGGGVFNEVQNSGSAVANLYQSTLSHNSNGNIYNQNGIINVYQSIISNSPSGNSDCENIGGSISDGGFNLVQDGTCGFPVGGDPILGILMDNGGDTQTRALQPGSPALDSVPPEQCGASIDQRDVARPYGAGCDIGAFELDSSSLEFAQSVNDQNVIPGQTITFTVHVNPIGPGITNGVISSTVPGEMNIHHPIQLDPPEAGELGESPILAHGITITANHGLTMTMAADISLGLPGGTDFDNTISFYCTEIITPVVTNITIHVNNASPIAVDDNGPLFETDPTTVIITGNVLDNDSDPNGDSITIVNFNTSNLLGSLTPLGIEPGKPLGNGTFSYDPDGKFNNLPPNGTATDSFTYQISDGQGGDFVQATVTILIRDDSHRIYLPLLTKGN